MRKIISAIDIDSDFIKLIVGEFYEDRLHILSASKVECKGLERGKIIDEESLMRSIKKAATETSDTLGIKLDKCLLGLNMVDTRLAKSASAVKITTDPSIITGKTVEDVMTKCADGKIPSDFVLSTVVPVEFTIDGDRVITRPVGKESTNLGLKGIVVASPKKL